MGHVFYKPTHKRRRTIMTKIPVLRACQLLLGAIFALFTIMSNATSSTLPNTVINRAGGISGLAFTPDGAYVYTANGNVIDMATFNLSTPIPGVPLNDPFSIAITPNGTTGYIVNQGNNTISIIDIATNTFTGNVADPHGIIPPQPGSSVFLQGIAITPDGSTAYITAKDEVYGLPISAYGVVFILDIATNTITGKVSDPDFTLNDPFPIAITPDGSKAYVVNEGYNVDNPGPCTISVLDIASNTITDEIYIADGLQISPYNGIVITPDGSTAYVTLNTSNDIIIIDVATNTQIGTITDSNFNGTAGIAITPDGNTLYVTSVTNVRPAPSVFIIDLTTNPATVVGSIVDTSNHPPKPSVTIAIPSNFTSNPYVVAQNFVESAGITYLIGYVPAPGILDPTFGNQGITLTPSSRQDFSKSLAVKSGGQIVLGGVTSLLDPQIFLAQYTVNGVLDTTFNSTGSTPGTQTLLVGSRTEGNALAIDSSGNILVAGFAIQSQTNMIVARYTSAGILDTTFNSTGYNTLSIGSGATANAIGLQSSGNIILAGTAVINGIPNIALARFTTSGALDTTFGTNGITTTQIGTFASIASVAIDSSHNIIVAGNANNQITVARYTPSGTLDNTFGTGGIVQPNIGSPAVAYSVIVDRITGSNHIVIAGSTKINGTNQSLIMRLTSTGTFDTSFNSTGYTITPIAYGSEFYTLVGNTSSSNTSYLTAGYANGAQSYQLSLAEYISNSATGVAVGQLNPAFGQSGVSLTNLGDVAYVKGSSLQPVPSSYPSEVYTFIVGGITNDTFFVGRYGCSLPPLI
jgi:uncharacterized delta-60 repeat protein